MGRLLPLSAFLLCSFLLQAEGNVGFLQKVVDEVKGNVQREMTLSLNQVKNATQYILSELSQSVRINELLLNNDIDKHISTFGSSCKPNALEMKVMAGKSLWSCLEMAQVVTDGVNIASGGFQAASDILGSLNNFLQSLTACIIGPMQSVDQEIACYLSAIGTIATDVAENIEEIVQYINVVKRDVEDIHDQIALCRNQTMSYVIENVSKQCQI